MYVLQCFLNCCTEIKSWKCHFHTTFKSHYVLNALGWGYILFHLSTFTVHHSVQESVSWAWIPFGFKCFWCRLIPFALIKSTFTVFYSAQESVSWVWIPQRLKYILVEVNQLLFYSTLSLSVNLYKTVFHGFESH